MRILVLAAVLAASVPALAMKHAPAKKGVHFVDASCKPVDAALIYAAKDDTVFYQQVEALVDANGRPSIKPVK